MRPHSCFGCTQRLLCPFDRVAYCFRLIFQPQNPNEIQNFIAEKSFEKRTLNPKELSIFKKTLHIERLRSNKGSEILIYENYYAHRINSVLNGTPFEVEMLTATLGQS